MKKTILLMVSALLLVGLYFVTDTTNAADDTKYQISVTGGTITFNVFSGTLDLPTFTVASSTGDHTTYNATYTAHSFVLEDLNATDDTWTIDMITSDLVGTNNTISKDQIYVQGAAVDTAAGPSTCSTDITAVSTSWANFASNTITLFTRPTLTNNTTCRVGTTLTMGVDVPAYQGVDTYLATITVTAVAGVVTPTYDPSLTY